MDQLKDARTAAQVVDVHVQKLRELAREGKIPSYRLSPRTLRFDLAELKQHMRKLARHGRKSS